MIHLVVTLKGHAVGQFRLEQDLVRVGRNPDNDVQIDNRSVSRYHCRLHLEAGRGWAVEDLGSHNGTTLNGARISTSASLQTGDTLGVGQFHVTVRTDEGSGGDGGEALLAVRAGGEAAERERRAPEKGHLLVEGLAEPLRLQRDLLQIGSAQGLDLSAAGPPKAALIVRGYGGFQLVNAAPGQARVVLDGASVADRARLHDGARIEVGDLRLTFHQGLPAEAGLSTIEIKVPANLRSKSD